MRFLGHFVIADRVEVLVGARLDGTLDETVRIVRTYKETGRVPNVVNLAVQTPATHMLVVRHRDVVGVLAHVLDALGAARINVQEMENVVFDGAQAAVARIHLDSAPDAGVIAAIAENEHIVATELITLG